MEEEVSSGEEPCHSHNLTLSQGDNAMYSLKTRGWQDISLMSHMKYRACVSTMTAHTRNTALPTSFVQHLSFLWVRESHL